MNRYAFFDVDETIINEKSMFSVLEAISHHFPNINSAAIRKRLQILRSSGVERDVVNRAFYKELHGLPQLAVQALAKKHITRRLVSKNAYIIENVMVEFDKCRRNGFEPVFVSGSALDFIQPLAKHLHVAYCLATRLICDAAGNYTGEIEGEPMIGQGKRHAVLTFLHQRNADPINCAAFGDHLSDLAFLEIMGHPHVVATSDSRLISIARQRGWPVIYP